MKRNKYVNIIIVVGVGVFILFISTHKFRINNSLSINYPFNKAVFPNEFPSPTLKWTDADDNINQWQVSFSINNSGFKIDTITTLKEWKPGEDDWMNLKKEAGNKKIICQVQRYRSVSGKFKKAGAGISISVSEDSAGAPILYREVVLPFAFAEANLEKLNYRLVNIGSPDPPFYSMQKFLVCGNCHSFSDDGRSVGLDLDAAKRDKGGYFIEDISDTIVFDTSNYLSWNKLQNRPTFGMFSKISPDGRYIVTTIKDRVMNENYGYGPDAIPFSQIFFPVNGVLAVYDRETKKLKELPGANLPGYVQSNAFWSPDGETIYFSRADALPYTTDDSSDIKIYDPEIVRGFMDQTREFKFDICKIPFNNGEGGTAEPVKGASANGRSNYFPAVSPDGKWLIFCQAENYMLLMPDSKLFIVPAEGGKARKLKCNLSLMNSWHAWSPNSKWIVFSSKGLSVYTDMFLAHIDSKGRASLPVLIENARARGMAANYPEFVNIRPDQTFKMIYNYVNLDHLRYYLNKGDTAMAKDLYQQYLDQGQFSLYEEYTFLAEFAYKLKLYSDAEKFANRALEIRPGDKALGYFLFKLKNKINSNK